ncbi:ribonuclease H-like domain-containing protein, partial [Tanacetum coccineum]
MECYNCHKTRHFARECRCKENQDSRRRDAWNSGNKAKDNGRRPGKQEEPKALVTLDGDGVDWTSHSEDEQENYALMAYSNSGSDTEEKIRFMKIDLDDETDVFTYHKKLLAEAEKEKEDLKAKVEKWHNSSKSLNIMLNSQMSVRDKAGIGFGNQIHEGVLSYENEVIQSVFDTRSSDIEDSPVNDRYTEGMHAVPPLLSGIFIPSGPNVEIDDSHVETNEYVPKPVTNEPKSVSDPKVWSDAPIIEEYESDTDEHVSLPTKEHETPSFTFVNIVKHVKTPRQTVIEQNTCSQNPKPNKRDWNGLMSKKLGLGYGFTTKACFVCGSFSHLIRDYDFHEKKMAKQVELNKQKGKGTVQRENKQVWNNVQRVNHQNQFVPTAVLIRTSRIPVNTARASSTNNVSTARHSFNSQAVPTNAARKVNTVKPIVNDVRPKIVFHKTHSPIRRPFKRTTAPKTNLANQKVNTAGDKAVSAVGSIGKTVVKPSAYCVWRPKRNYVNKFSKYNGGSNSRKFVNSEDPHKALKNKGIVDSGCSRHMTGNKAYLVDYQDYNGGHVAFEGSKGYITGKGKIRIGKLDFKDVCFVKELQLFNLFSVSQMCDKNKVLFTDTECLVLSLDFKLPDENQVLLRVPRQNNIYSFNLENIVPSGGLACLIAKATVDESNKWHRRLGHVNFKNLNKLVKRNLVRGLPSKIFQNNHTCVACQKGKQHKASCKAKSVSFISQPLQLLHMDLFGPTSVRSINHKTYCLVITDDFSSYTRPFGCHVTILNTIDQLGKFDEKSDEGFLVGKRTYLAVDPDYLTDSMNYQPVRIENQANKTAGPKEANHSACTQDNTVAGNSKLEDEPAQEYCVLPSWSSNTSTIKSSEAKNRGDKPKKDTGLKTNEKPVDKEEQAFLEELERLKRQEKEAHDESKALRQEFAQSTEDLLRQTGAARASSTITVNAVSTPVSTASPSRVFSAGESSFPVSTNYNNQDDSQIPALKDTYDNPSHGIFSNA